MSKLKIIISGGGTGGHIFPAIAIATAVQKLEPQCEILFVGALGKMEMEKVPAAGFTIVGLPVAGFHRTLTLRNLAFPFKLISSMFKAYKVVKDFAPNAVVGVGGYASGPVLKVASMVNVPSLLQEQNSFPGITNRILAKKANRICVAYHNMDRFFPSSKLLMTGNPVRSGLASTSTKQEAATFWKLDPNKKTILILGGSLGARSVNNGILLGLDKLDDNVQLLWQTGKIYVDEMRMKLPSELVGRVKIMDFIANMSMAFAVADVVVSRAGASSISELALLGKPSIFVPSPNVSEDHQTKNALALVEKQAAQMIADANVADILPQACLLLSNEAALSALATNIQIFAKPNAAEDIALEVIKLAKSK